MRAFFSTYGRLIVIGILATVLLVVAGVAVYRAGYAAGDPPAAQGNTSVPPTLEPGEKTTVNTQAQSQTCVIEDGKPQGNIDYRQFRKGDGYLIPVKTLKSWADSSHVLIFEGEHEKIGQHDVIAVVLPGGVINDPASPTTGFALRNQGAFWVFPGITSSSCQGKYFPIDVKLMGFASIKRRNWIDEKNPGAPIVVWMSDGTKRTFAPSLTEIPLSDAEKTVEDTVTAMRCPLDDNPLLENPFGKPSGDNEVIGAPGADRCRTLMVFTDQKKALWFSNARDGVVYNPAATNFYLIPAAWGQNEINNWVKTQFGIDSAPMSEPPTSGSSQ